MCGTFKGGRGKALVFGGPEAAPFAVFAVPFAAGTLLGRGAPIALTSCDTPAGCTCASINLGSQQRYISQGLAGAQGWHVLLIRAQASHEQATEL